MSAEVWAPIPNFPGYKASDLGQIRSSKRRSIRVLRSRRNPRTGRWQVDLQVDGKRHTKCTYQLVLLAFRGPPPPGQQARHVISNDLSDNRLSNLEYGTPLENSADCMRHGTRLSGERHPRARVRDDLVARVAADPRSVSTIAAELGVSRSQVRYYKRGVRSDPNQAERRRSAGHGRKSEAA